MKNKNLFVIVGLIAFGIIGLIIIGSKINPKISEVKVVTDKTEYDIEEALKVKIENGSARNLCFSSCYPYYFEKKNNGWESYNYSGCLTANLVEKCVAPKDLKAFQLTVPTIKKGTHRLAIPVCVNCDPKETFKGNNWVYSNEFTIK